jgi:predicted metalloprotease
VEFDEKAQLDPSQVQDRRGQGGRVGRGPGQGVAIGVGGGGIGLIIFLIAALLGVNPYDPGSQTGLPPESSLDGLADQTAGDATESDVARACRTGADANTREDCRIVGFVNSIQEYWSDEFGRRQGRYVLSRTVFFDGDAQTGCGLATSAVGPFYCPMDGQVYIDLDFYDELRTRFGARGGPFAQAYVLAHEYGHHVQNLTGTLERAQSGDSGPQSMPVRVELQADCYAGVWARHASSTGYLTELTEADIADGLNAAAAVGDDRIQRQVQGRVNPERWTHGSAEQRQRWFITGYQTGDVAACNTFRGRV